MFQEIEGQKPIVISRNHMDRIRPPVYRWVQPADWSPAWNYERSLLTGLAYGASSSMFYQFHTPATELATYYQTPNSFTQLRIFTREIFKMESFKRGLGSKLAFYSSYGMAFEGTRFYLWKNLAGGFPHNTQVVDVAWYKKFITALTVGISSMWIPVPFVNIAIRYHQDQILPKELSRGYKGYMDAAFKIAKNDGLFPFFRGGGPMMIEKALQTTGLFFWMDFLKDKLKHMEHWGTDHPGFSQNYLRFLYVSFGTYIGLLYGYPLVVLRNYVEKLPLNSKGEMYFASYSEAIWKGLGDNYEFTGLWSGFHRYLLKCGPPLFLTVWFADVIGLLDQHHPPPFLVPT